MAILTPQGHATPRQVGSLGLQSQVTPDPGVSDNIMDSPGTVETISASWQTNTVSGGVAQQMAFWWLTKDEEDSSPRLDMYDPNIRDPLLKEMPYLLEDYNSGRMLDIRTDLQRDVYLNFRKKDHDLQQRAGQGPFLANMAGAMVGDAWMMVAGARMLTMPRLIGRASIGAKSWQVARTLAGNAAIGAAENVAHEGARQLIKPVQVDNAEQNMYTAMEWGAYFGAGVPAVFAGIGGAGKMVAGRTVLKVTSDVSGSQIQEIVDTAKKFIDQNVEDLTEIRNGIPEGDIIINPLDHPASKKVQDEIIAKYEEAGFKVEVRDHPQQDMVNVERAANFLNDQFGSEDRIAQLPSGLVALLSAVSAGRKVNRAGSAQLEMFNTLFDNNVNGKVSDDPLTTANSPSAESLRQGWENSADNYNASTNQLMADYFNNGGQEFQLTLGDGSVISLKRGASSDEWGIAVREYVLQKAEIRDGVRTEFSFDAPKQLKQSAELWSEAMVESLDKLDDAGLLGGVKALEAQTNKRGTLQDQLNLHTQAVEARGTTLDELTKGEGGQTLKKANDTIGRIEQIPKGERSLQDNLELAQAQKTFNDIRDKKRGSDPDRAEGELTLDERRKLEKELREVEDSIETIADRLENADTYVSRIWKSNIIKNDEVNFKEQLVAQFRENRRWRKGRTIEPENKRIRQGALDELDDFELSDGRQASDALSEMLTESDFDKVANAADQLALRESYEVAMEKYFKTAAEDVFVKLTNAETAHGTEAVHGSNFFKERGLRISDRKFTKYLETNSNRIMEKYTHNISGRGAVAQAMKFNEAKLRPLSEALLPGVEFKGTMEHMRAMMAAYNRELRKAGRAISDAAGNDKMIRRLNKIMNGTDEIIKHKGDELLGILKTGSEAVDASWSRPLVRIGMKFPFLAYMGGMLTSSIPDLAAAVAMTGWTPHKLRQIGRALIPFKEFDRRGLEVFAATADEATSSRAFRLWDIEARSGDIRTNDGTSAAVMDWIDQRTDLAARKLTIYSGMNWWNRNLKRAVGHQFVQESLDVQKKMVLIQRDLDALGHKASEAERTSLFKKHKLRIEDAKRWNKLGINANRAERFLRNTWESGSHLKGDKQLKDALTFDEFLTDRNFTYLEAEKWAKTDRRLFDIYTSAVDRMINSTIVDPNLLARPSVNRFWWGKMFNQFFSFGYAYGTQTIPVAQQQGGMRFAGFLSMATGMGLLTEALKNEIAGRQTLEESAQQLVDNPMLAMRRAVDRAGILGWMTRPMTYAEKAPIIKPWLGEGPSSMHGHNTVSFAGMLGPLPDMLAGGLQHGLNPLLGGKGFSATNQKSLIKMIPFRNLLGYAAWKRYMWQAGVDGDLPEAARGQRYQGLDPDWETEPTIFK